MKPLLHSFSLIRFSFFVQLHNEKRTNEQTNKRKTRIYTILTLILLITSASRAEAQGVTACQARMTDEMIAVKDTYRSYLFGSTASGAKVRVKSGGETSVERKGIFESPGHMTSDLVPAVVQSYQAYRCRMEGICAVMRGSLGHPSKGAWEIPVDSLSQDMLGCDVSQSVPNREPYPECSGELSLDEYANIVGFCGTMIQRTLAVERETLKLAVAYDATYRSMLQFTGMLDWMLGDGRVRALIPLRDAVRWLGRLHTIPCFIGQCDQVTP